MLKSLHIRNYALIENLQVQFDDGLNIITGETGAGKSIIIDALSLALGERSDTEAVRKDAEKAVIEAIFGAADNRKLKSLFDENALIWSDDLILRREVSAKGQSRCFVNDSPVTLAIMRDIGNLLVDLHGQHDHQSLLRPDTHVDVLDEFGGLERLRKEFHEAYTVALQRRGELESLRERQHQLQDRRDLYEFQVKEIDAVSPRAGEEDDLERELTILENSEKLFEATSRLYAALYEGDNAIHDQLVLARNSLEDLSGIDDTFLEAKEECASAVAIVNELAKFIQQYNSRVEFNPERLEQIRERLGHLSLLKKKYGGSVESILAHRERVGQELNIAENFESTLASFRQQFEQDRKAATDVAQRLSAKRKEIAKKIGPSVVSVLTELGIPNARFKALVEQRETDNEERGLVSVGKKLYETLPHGIDNVELHISTNVGEDPKPLVKVASGGEISRVMLALKTVLAKSDRLPLLIFDEIDAGVSGRIAQAVGTSLKSLSQFHQVIAITHLPQIAALADNHFIVEKTEEGDRTYTRMKKLTANERVREVATLMSGAEVTKAGLVGAKELMGLK